MFRPIVPLVAVTLIVIAGFPAAATASAPAVSVDFVGQWGGTIHAVAVQGDYAYAANHNSGLQVFDVSDPASPQWVGGCDTSGYAFAVAVSGNYAHIADGSAGLQVIAVSNPTDPQRVGGYNTSGETWDVAVSGDYAYVADSYAGLQVIDVSNPTSPQWVGGYDTSGSARGVAVSGDYAYVADYYAGLQVIDVSTPSNPQWIGAYWASGQANDVAVSGDYAYVTDYNYGLQVIDVSTPSNPQWVGSYATSSYACGVAVSRNYAYVAGYGAGLHVIDVSDPSKPQRAGGYDTSGYALGVAVSGLYAFVADDNGGLLILRVGDCNDNGIPDEEDIANCDGSAWCGDCDGQGNGIPDGCEPDCNNNAQADSCDISEGTSLDCNRNTVPDECDIDPTDPDGNGQVSADLNADGIPDECGCFPSTAAQPERLALPGNPISKKIRYLSFTAGDAGRSQAIRVTFQNVPAPYAHWNGTQLWVQEPVRWCNGAGQKQATGNPPSYGCGAGGPSYWFWRARLTCDPYYTDWTQYGLVHVWSEGIIPLGAYDIQLIDSMCAPEVEESYSAALIMTESRWADLVSNCTTNPCGPPDNSTGIVDVTAILDKFKNLPGAIHKTRGDIEGAPSGDARIPNGGVDITDVVVCLGAFLGQPYPPPGYPPPGNPPTCP